MVGALSLQGTQGENGVLCVYGGSEGGGEAPAIGRVHSTPGEEGEERRDPATL